MAQANPVEQWAIKTKGDRLYRYPDGSVVLQMERKGIVSFLDGFREPLGAPVRVEVRELPE